MVIAPTYDQEAIDILEEKKNRIILILNDIELPQTTVRTCFKRSFSSR